MPQRAWQITSTAATIATTATTTPAGHTNAEGRSWGRWPAGVPPLHPLNRSARFALFPFTRCRRPGWVREPQGSAHPPSGARKDPGGGALVGTSRRCAPARSCARPCMSPPAAAASNQPHISIGVKNQSRACPPAGNTAAMTRSPATPTKHHIEKSAYSEQSPGGLRILLPYQSPHSRTASSGAALERRLSQPRARERARQREAIAATPLTQVAVQLPSNCVSCLGRRKYNF